MKLITINLIFITMVFFGCSMNKNPKLNEEVTVNYYQIFVDNDFSEIQCHGIFFDPLSNYIIEGYKAYNSKNDIIYDTSLLHQKLLFKIKLSSDNKALVINFEKDPDSISYDKVFQGARECIVQAVEMKNAKNFLKQSWRYNIE